MSRRALVVRPEPGGAATAARLAALGLDAVRLPLFAVTPLPWSPPPATFDALLLTSANAVRHAGPALADLRMLPVVAVGGGTAAAAEAHGLQVAAIGTGDAADALSIAHAQGWRRVIRLAGRERTPLAGVTDVPVYASDPLSPPPGALESARSAVALLHSTRAARFFADLIDRDRVPRREVRLAAISAAVAGAAGTGWDRVLVAAAPSDQQLVAAARTLAIDP